MYYICVYNFIVVDRTGPSTPRHATMNSNHHSINGRLSGKPMLNLHSIFSTSILKYIILTMNKI